MAGKTTYLRIAAKSSLVDVQDHFDHFARRLLLGLIIQVKSPVTVVIDVAIVALNAQRSAHEVHDRDELPVRQTLEYLNILTRLIGSLLLLNLKPQREVVPQCQGGLFRHRKIRTRVRNSHRGSGLSHASLDHSFRSKTAEANSACPPGGGE